MEITARKISKSSHLISFAHLSSSQFHLQFESSDRRRACSVAQATGATGGGHLVVRDVLAIAAAVPLVSGWSLDWLRRPRSCTSRLMHSDAFATICCWRDTRIQWKRASWRAGQLSGYGFPGRTSGMATELASRTNLLSVNV